MEEDNKWKDGESKGSKHMDIDPLETSYRMHGTTIITWCFPLQEFTPSKSHRVVVLIIIVFKTRKEE